MKKIKVYLQFPWKISDSQYYKSLMENPPKDVEYFPTNQNNGMILSKKRLKFVNFLKGIPRKILETLELPIINVHKTSTYQEYDLIHCAHCLSKNDEPWVADFESLWQMWVSGRDTEIGIKKVKNILKNKNCKAIIAWTNAAKREIIKRYPEIKKKVHVVGFGQKKQIFEKKKKKNIQLVFIGRYFFWKGGLHAVEAMDRLTRKYENVEALVISQTPKDLREKYSINKKMNFMELIPHEKLNKEIFPFSDILIYPGYSDTFGFIFPEAMSFGIPVVTIDGFARKEIVKDGKTGKVIELNKQLSDIEMKSPNEKIVKEIVKETSLLIDNEKLREKMSRNCLKEVEYGMFSIEKRNEKLRRIYEKEIK